MPPAHHRQVLPLRRGGQMALDVSQVLRLRRGVGQPVVLLRARREHLLQGRLHQVSLSSLEVFLNLSTALNVGLTSSYLVTVSKQNLGPFGTKMVNISIA